MSEADFGNGAPRRGDPAGIAAPPRPEFSGRARGRRRVSRPEAGREDGLGLGFAGGARPPPATQFKSSRFPPKSDANHDRYPRRPRPMTLEAP
jgi:hypothetical protein